MPRCQALRPNGQQCESRSAAGEYCRNHPEGSAPPRKWKTFGFSVSLEAHERLTQEAAERGVSVSWWILDHLPGWVSEGRGDQ